MISQNIWSINSWDFMCGFIIHYFYWWNLESFRRLNFEIQTLSSWFDIPFEGLWTLHSFLNIWTSLFYKDNVYWSDWLFVYSKKWHAYLEFIFCKISFVYELIILSNFLNFFSRTEDIQIFFSRTKRYLVSS